MRMAMARVPSRQIYGMHHLIEQAYNGVHDWLDSDPDMCRYRSLSEADASKALGRDTPVLAAFNFNYYFPTHYFKACHALQSDDIIGLDRLGAWLRYNPYLAIIDVGCGDGAGSVAGIETVLRLRECGQIDPRPVQMFCLAACRRAFVSGPGLW